MRAGLGRRRGGSDASSCRRRAADAAIATAPRVAANAEAGPGRAAPPRVAVPSVPQWQKKHAYSLRLPHPASGEELEIVAPLPNDMLTAARALRLRPLSEGRERGLDDAVQQLQAELLVT